MPQQMEGILNLPDYEVLSSEGSSSTTVRSFSFFRSLSSTMFR